MKKKLTDVALLNDVELTYFSSYRSDTGCQIYYLKVSKNGLTTNFEDSHRLKEVLEKQLFIDRFTKFIASL